MRSRLRLLVALILIVLATVAVWAQVTGVRVQVVPGAPPVLSSLSVTTGQYGTAVTLTGSGFGAAQGQSAVYFNGIIAAVSSWAATSIAVTVPVNATSGNVVVIEDGAPSNAITFTIAAPTVSGLSVSTGAVGDPVTITGTNFGTTQGLSRVTFNGTFATVTSWSGTSLATKVPAGATSGNVVVTVGNQTTTGVAFTVGGGAVGEQIYLASAATGGNTGANCANAKAYTFFNSAANWSATVLPSDGKISPGDTVHLCGTITGTANSTGLTFQGSGLVGNPITVQFEAGAILQAPYWQSAAGGADAGAITFGHNKSHVVIDGGSNGVIQNTANGSALTFKQPTVAISGWACTDCEVKNLTIANMYIETNGSAAGMDGAFYKTFDFTGSNWKIHNTIQHDCGWCIFNNYANNDTDTEVYNNTIYNFNHAMAFANVGGVACIAPCLKFYNNDIGSSANWSDPPTCSYHDDGLHAFGGVGGSMDGLEIHDNYFHGDWGGCPTGYVYLEQGASQANARSWVFYNNVAVNQRGTGETNDNTTGWFGLFSGISGTQKIYNNTFISYSTTNNNKCWSVQALSGVTFENNTVQNCGINLDFEGNTVVAINRNVYGTFGGNSWVWTGPTFTGSFAGWKAACACDANSIQTNSILMNGDGSPQANSPLISAGANLASAATGALASLIRDTTLGGTQGSLSRASGAIPWDVGAFMYPDLNVGGANCQHLPASLGTNWTLVDCNALSANHSFLNQPMAFLHGGSVQTGDVLVGLVDCDMLNTTGSCAITLTDNAVPVNTWCELPVTAGSVDNNPKMVRHLNYFYTTFDGTCGVGHPIGSRGVKASGYTMIVSTTATGGGTIADIDYSLMLFRHTTGQASAGLGTMIGAFTVGNSAAAPCTSGPHGTGCAAVPGGQTIAVTAGSLVIGGGNQLNTPSGQNRPFQGVDGDGTLFAPIIPAYYTYGAEATSTGPMTLTWYQTITGATSSGLFEIKGP